MNPLNLCEKSSGPRHEQWLLGPWHQYNRERICEKDFKPTFSTIIPDIATADFLVTRPPLVIHSPLLAAT